MSIKQKLYNHCQEFVNNKLQLIEKTIQSNKEGLNSETKSSAGDKHETGRAMLQLEMEKAGQQLQVVSEMKTTLERINMEDSSSICKLGSIVNTNKISYFISISAGQLEVEGDIYYAISTKSPIGKLLIGKEKGDNFYFNGNQYNVDFII